MSMLDYQLTIEFGNGQFIADQPEYMISAIIGVAHGLMANRQVQFAVSLPHARPTKGLKKSTLGRTIRFFCSDRDALDDLVQRIEEDPWYGKVFKVYGSRKVPRDFKGEWMKMDRFSVTKHRENREELNKKRYIDSGFMPYVRINTRSTDRSFNMHLVIDRLGPDEAQEKLGNPWEQAPVPNGYGFSTPSKGFYLPVL